MSSLANLWTNVKNLRRRVADLETAGPGGGVTDHGALTGLSDDDHGQYHNDTRGDARYSLLGHTHVGGGGGSGEVIDLGERLSGLGLLDGGDRV